ncbi:hypothetical protein GDO81_024315 [Engystomops pustulosus]|uniref:Uncharacterized protein n=1 Tax=Engystomops pustulosus TaxID=76066 RepID=A0AAV6YU83_ENGPU|nr:hypothetical protein GDO81_024315 [Engystomops pustulosus]
MSHRVSKDHFPITILRHTQFVYLTQGRGPFYKAVRTLILLCSITHRTRAEIHIHGSLHPFDMIKRYTAITISFIITACRGHNF